MLETLTLSLLISIFVGLSAGYLGSLMVLEKMALVGDALSHVALPGLAIGYLLNFNPFIGGFAFLFVSAVIIWYVQRITRLSFEALVGASFTLALAIGIILIPDSEALLEALFGDITTVVTLDALIAVTVALVSILLTRVIYKKLVLAMISEDLAISKGIDVAKTNLLYLFLVSSVVAIGLKIVGTLLVGFLVIVPAIAARTLSTNMFRYTLLSAVFGVISAFSGILLTAYFPNIPPGPLVVLSGILIFAITIIINRAKKLTI